MSKKADEYPYEHWIYWEVTGGEFSSFVLHEVSKYCRDNKIPMSNIRRQSMPFSRQVEIGRIA